MANGESSEVEANAELVQQTRAVWGKKLKREISEGEALTIIRNFQNFLRLLREIQHGQ
jgi:hypothetical protein